MKAIREQRMSDHLRQRMEELQEQIADPDERLAAMGNLMLPLDSYELIASEAEFTPPVIYSAGSREKLVFLVEARLENGAQLRPGLPVDIVVP